MFNMSRPQKHRGESKMLIKEDKVIFEITGREEYANCGIIGLEYNKDHERKDEFLLSYGYDGGFPIGYGNELKPEEKIELAGYYIELWGKYMEKAKEQAAIEFLKDNGI